MGEEKRLFRSGGGREVVMNIAVICDQAPHSGGAFEHQVSTLRLLGKHQDERHRFVFIATEAEGRRALEERGIRSILWEFSLLDQVLSRMRRNEILYGWIRAGGMWRHGRFDRFLMSLGIDLVYFLSPHWLSLAVEAHSYVITVYDLCHRDCMEFPEVSARREFEGREKILREALPKAVAIIADSDLGKQNIVRRYGIDEWRVKALHYLSPGRVPFPQGDCGERSIDILRKYGIQGEYIFYPAHFWPHKNHRYILDALRILKERHGKKVKAVFCGIDKGNRDFILRKAEEEGIQDQVVHIGFAAETEMPHFYREALALVMPTYFGPTNIPPIEAFALGCPVCYPDLEGLRDQVRDAAFLMDLKDPGSLAGILAHLLEDRYAAAERVERGRKLIGRWNEEAYWRALEGVFEDYRLKRRCWE
jgi:glycosyltransferase involved in cell wall biosynthesis